MNDVSQVNGELRFGAFLSLSRWVRGAFNKGSVTPASDSVPEIAALTSAPSFLAPKPVSLALLIHPLCFDLLPQHWSPV